MEQKYRMLSIGMFIIGIVIETQAAPVLVSDPLPPFDLGIARNNTIGADFGIALTNTGDSAASNLSCGWDGGTSFTDTGCDGASVSAGGMFAFTVNAVPTTFGTLTDTLQIDYGEGTLDLLVSVMVPELWIEPNSYTFADTIVGNSDGPQAFTVTNDHSSNDHSIHTLDQSGDTTSFNLTGFGRYPYHLAPGQSSNLYVTFVPTTTGLLASNIELGSPDAIIMAITVEGTGVVPVPAAVWLFGSGLIGLICVARRKKT